MRASFVAALRPIVADGQASQLDIQLRLLRGRIKYLRRALTTVRGGDPGECPVCGYCGYFINFGTPAQIGSRCPSCGSAARHRLLKLVDDSQHIVPAGAHVLHFAPEACAGWLRVRAGRYVTADRRPGRDLQVDIEHLEVPDASFDVVICSHVLEHVDDRLALAHLHRVLRPGGILITMVPIVEGWDHTYENTAIRDPKDRKLHFDGATHVRYYGRDFRDRLAAAGFGVSEYTCKPDEVVRYRLQRGERIFVGNVRSPA